MPPAPISDSSALADPFDDFRMQAELDVREIGLSQSDAVDLGMQIWSKGLKAGIGYARRMLDESERWPAECVVCQQMRPAEAFEASSTTCRECESITSWFRRLLRRRTRV